MFLFKGTFQIVMQWLKWPRSIELLQVDATSDLMIIRALIFITENQETLLFFCQSTVPLQLS